MCGVCNAMHLSVSVFFPFLSFPPFVGHTHVLSCELTYLISMAHYSQSILATSGGTLIRYIYSQQKDQNKERLNDSIIE